MTLEQFQFTRVPGDTVRRGCSAHPSVPSPRTGGVARNELASYTAWRGLRRLSGRDSSSTPARAASRRWMRVGLCVAAVVLGVQLERATSASAHQSTVASPAWVSDPVAGPPPAPSEVSIMTIQAVIPGGNMGHGWIRVSMQWPKEHTTQWWIFRGGTEVGYCDGIDVPATWTVVRQLGRTHRVETMRSSDAFLNSPSRAGACYRVEIFNVTRSATHSRPPSFNCRVCQPASKQDREVGRCR